MKPTSLLSKFWIEFVADDLAELPGWVQRSIERDAKLSRWVDMRRELESDLKSQSDSWCELTKPADRDYQISSMNPQQIDEIFETRTAPPEGGFESVLETAGNASERDTDRTRSSNRLFLAVAAAVLIPLSVWIVSSLQKPEGGEPLASGNGESKGATIRQVDFKPVLATAAASQRMAMAVKESSVAFLSRVAEVTSSDALALPIADSATLIQEAAGQWKEGPKQISLAMVRFLDSTPGDAARSEGGEAVGSKDR